MGAPRKDGLRGCVGGRAPAVVSVCGASCRGVIHATAPAFADRRTVTLRLALMDRVGELLNDTALEIEVFPAPERSSPPRAHVFGAQDGPGARLSEELELPVAAGSIGPGDIGLCDDPRALGPRAQEVAAAVQAGATALLLDWPEGRHQVAGTEFSIAACGMNPRHVVARAPGHPLVDDLRPRDLRLWYDSGEGRITPLLKTVFTAPDWTPILLSGNGGWGGAWGPALAAAERRDGRGMWRLCQVELAGRVSANPPAAILARRLLGPGAEDNGDERAGALPG